MEKLNLKSVPKTLKPDPIFAGLSDSLKDPKSYKRIEKKLFKMIQTTHKHKTATSYVKCEACQIKRMNRQKMIKDLGFQSIQQYMAYKKIMDIITNKKSFQLK